MSDHELQRHLRCPLCEGTAGSDVVDSRCTGTAIRRRRQCVSCGERFTTYEVTVDPLVLEAQRARAKPIAEQLRQMASALEVW